MKLRPVSYLILGMVRFGIASGYAIKRAADAGTSYFWPISLAQIYPELGRLEQAGLLLRHDDSRGARPRAAYELTEAGQRALLAWLRSPLASPPQLRSEGMLRAFFSDALPKQDQLAGLRRQRRRILALKTGLFESELTAAGRAIEAAGIRYPIVLAEWGEAFLGFTYEWLTKLEARLEGELADLPPPEALPSPRPPEGLRPASWLVLGLVRFGATSGYAIKKAADAATGSIWPISLAQIYPELGRLEQAGLLLRHDDSRGARPRAAYELTEAGQRALLAWLRSPEEAPPQFRYDALLRVFFADALPKEDQLAGVRRHRELLLYAKAHLFDGDLRAAAKAIDAGGMHYPLIIGDYAEDALDFTHEWLGELEKTLEKEMAA